MSIQTGDSCVTCRFASGGLCKRYPPQYHPNHNYGQWPRVWDPETEWCGEHMPVLGEQNNE